MFYHCNECDFNTDDVNDIITHMMDKHPINGQVYFHHHNTEKKKPENVAEVLEACIRYIEFSGGNYTTKGLPHPQQLLLDKAHKALDGIKKC